MLVDPASVGAELLEVDRGGDVTFHGPGQLVAYPMLTLPTKGGVARWPARHARLRAAARAGAHRCARSRSVCTDVGRQDGCPGVWVEPNTPRTRKLAAIGVRIERGRSLHGIALNVTTDMGWFGHIVPCGIADKGVTSLAAEGVDVDLRAAADAFVAAFERHWQPAWSERSDVVWRTAETDLAPFSRGAGPGRTDRRRQRRRPRSPADRPTARRSACSGRLAEAGVAESVALTDRKPEWMRAPVRHGAGVLQLKQTVRDLGLVTVCEEAGCPNLSECWSEGTATFMVCGERCTRACGFCLVDTRRPDALDAGEPGTGRRGRTTHGPGLRGDHDGGP